MRFMILGFANEDTEAGQMPDERGLELMGEYNEELVRRACCSRPRACTRHPARCGSRSTVAAAARLK